jgi:hypothetical protein
MLRSAQFQGGSAGAIRSTADGRKLEQQAAHEQGSVAVPEESDRVCTNHVLTISHAQMLQHACS